MQRMSGVVVLTVLGGMACGAPPEASDASDEPEVVVIEPSRGDRTEPESEDEPEVTPVPSAKVPAPGAPALPCNAALSAALRSAIRAQEARELGAGMKPHASYTCAVVSKGGMATVETTLNPGNCYSFIGHAFPGVTEIDLTVKPHLDAAAGALPPGLAAAVLAKDADSGPSATIGRGASCFKNPFPFLFPVRVEVMAREGGGPVAIQIFEK